MTPSLQIKTLRPTLIAASVTTFLLCQRHLGFAVLFEAILLTPWAIASLWVGIRNPQQRSIQAAKVGIWLLSIGIVIGVHYFVATQTRADAQKVVEAVLSYHASHGTYPEDIEAVGYTKGDLRSMIGMGGYFIEEGRPSFFYASTFVPFETDHYDFSKQMWVHRD